jgi:hypothetical protein
MSLQYNIIVRSRVFGSPATIIATSTSTTEIFSTHDYMWLIADIYCKRNLQYNTARSASQGRRCSTKCDSCVEGSDDVRSRRQRLRSQRSCSLSSLNTETIPKSACSDTSILHSRSLFSVHKSQIRSHRRLYSCSFPSSYTGYSQRHSFYFSFLSFLPISSNHIDRELRLIWLVGRSVVTPNIIAQVQFI